MKKEVFEFFHGGFGIKIPYYIFGDLDAEKTILITGGMHGNEINGISIARKIIDILNEKSSSDFKTGRIIIIPILNPTGFNRMQREVAIDNKDPNRSFGHTSKKTWTNYRADAISENFLSKANYVIDIHDAGGRGMLVPHSRMHMCNHGTCDTDVHTMAKLLDTKFILEREGNNHYLAIHCGVKYQTPALTVEIGGEQHSFKEGHSKLVQGIQNILIHFGFLEGTIGITNNQYIYSSKRSTYKSLYAAEIYMSSKLGDYVQRGDILGVLYNPLTGSKENIIAHVTGYIFSQRALNQIPMNASMYSIIEQE